MNKKQKAANAAFIKKIQSLNISTGKKDSAPNCPDCGKPMLLVPGIIIPSDMLPFYPHHDKPKDSGHEEAFAA